MLGNGELLSILTEQRVILASAQVAQGSKGPTQPTTQLNKTQVVYQKAHLKQIPGQLGLIHPHLYVTEFRLSLQHLRSMYHCRFPYHHSNVPLNSNCLSAFSPSTLTSLPLSTSVSHSHPHLPPVHPWNLFYLLPPGNLCATVCSEVNSSILNISEYDGSMNCQFIILALANIHT